MVIDLSKVRSSIGLALFLFNAMISAAVFIEVQVLNAVYYVGGQKIAFSGYPYGPYQVFAGSCLSPAPGRTATNPVCEFFNYDQLFAVSVVLAFLGFVIWRYYRSGSEMRRQESDSIVVKLANGRMSSETIASPQVTPSNKEMMSKPSGLNETGLDQQSDEYAAKIQEELKKNVSLAHAEINLLREAPFHRVPETIRNDLEKNTIERQVGSLVLEFQKLQQTKQATMALEDNVLKKQKVVIDKVSELLHSISDLEPTTKKPEQARVEIHVDRRESEQKQKEVELRNKKLEPPLPLPEEPSTGFHHEKSDPVKSVVSEPRVPRKTEKLAKEQPEVQVEKEEAEQSLEKATRPESSMSKSKALKELRKSMKEASKVAADMQR